MAAIVTSPANGTNGTAGAAVILTVPVGTEAATEAGRAGAALVLAASTLAKEVARRDAPVDTGMALGARAGIPTICIGLVKEFPEAPEEKNRTGGGHGTG